MHRNRRATRLRSIRRIILSPAIAAAFGLHALRASGANVTWDSSGSSACNPVAGSGTWDLSSVQWSNGTIDSTWSNSGSDTANFGNPGASTSTITLNAGVFAAGLNFAGGSYYLNTGGNSSYGFDLGSAGTIQLNSAAQVTVSGVFYQTLTTLSGSGTFVTSGNNDNNGSGFVVNSGVTLVCDKQYNTGHAIGGLNLLINTGGLAQLTETGSAGQVSGQFYVGANVTVASGGMLDTKGDSEVGTSLSISGTGISNGGALTNGAASTTSTLTFSNVYLQGNANIGGAGNLVTNGPISNAYALTIVGSGTQTLSGSNTYSAGTTVSGGTLSISSNANLGSSGSSLTLNGGTLGLTAGITSARNVIIGASGGAIDTGSFASTISGEVSGGNLTLIDNGSLTLSGTVDNSGLGVIVDNGATVVLAKASGAHAHAIGGGGLLINSGGTAQLAGSGTNQVYGSGLITVHSGGVFDLNGQSQDNAAMSGSMFLGGTGIGGGGALINSAASTTSTYTMYPDTKGNGVIFLTADSSIGGAGNLVIDGAITDPSAATSYAITKVGGGTLILTGANTFTGATTVSAGVLLANTIENSATGTGDVTVMTSGTLGGGPRANGGGGQISGNVTIANGVTQATAGNITAGNAFINPSQARSTAQDSDTGTLAIGGNLTLQGPSATGNTSGGSYLWKVDGSNGTHDQLAVTGSITVAAAHGPFKLVVEQIGSTITPANRIIASASLIDVYSNPANPTAFTAYSVAIGNVPSAGVPLSSSIFAPEVQKKSPLVWGKKARRKTTRV